MKIIVLIGLIAILAVVCAVINIVRGEDPEEIIPIEKNPEKIVPIENISYNEQKLLGATELAIKLRGRGMKILINGKSHVVYTDEILSSALEEIACKLLK